MTVAAPRTTAGARLPSAVLGVLGLVGFLAVLELAPRIGLVPERYLPPASNIIERLWTELGSADFWVALGDTLRGWGLGLAIAFFAALALGVVIGSVPWLRRATASTIEFLRPIPSVALIPLAVLLYGTELGSTLLLVIYASFWQVLIQVLQGVADVDPVVRETARSYRLGRVSRVRHVVWPSAAPYVLTGLRLGAAVALILAITAELVIGSPGLGREIAVAQQSGAVDAVYALVLATGLLGVIVNVGVRLFERRLLSWHVSVRGEVPV